MKELIHSFTPQQWVVIIAAGTNALAGAVLAYQFFNSRWWREMVVGPEGRVVAQDLFKAAGFILGCALIIAIAVAKLGYNREAGGELVALVYGLLGVAGFMQFNKRLEKKDVVEANKPEAPRFEMNNSNVGIGPVGATQAAAAPAPTEQILAGYNDGPASTTGRGPTFQG